MRELGVAVMFVASLVACSGSTAPPKQPSTQLEQPEAVAAPTEQPEAVAAPTEESKTVPAESEVAPVPAVQPEPEPAPMAQSNTNPAPTCLEVGVHFAEWVDSEVGDVTSIPEESLGDVVQRVCTVDRWTSQDRQCMGSAATHDDWKRCFRTVRDPPPLPPKRPLLPHIVPQTLLEGNRISGDKDILPDNETKATIQKSGPTRLVGSFKLCLDEKGSIRTISPMKSTGFQAYDDKIQREMNQWRYRPFMVNGKAVPVCTAIIIRYSQK